MFSSLVFKKVLLVGLVLAALLSLLQGFNNGVIANEGSKDTQWHPSHKLLYQQNPYEIFLNPETTSNFIMCQVPNYPASGLVMLWPIAMFDWPLAKILWALANLVFTGLILYYLFKLFLPNISINTKIIVACLFLIGLPWRNGIGNGQHALFSMAFFLLALYMFQSDKKWTGIPLAASWLKGSLTFPMTLYFTKSKKGWVPIAMAIAVHIVLTILVAIWIKTLPHHLFFGHLQVALQSSGTGFLDIYAITERLGISGNFIPVLVSLLFLVTTYWVIRKDADTLSALSTLSLTTLVINYHRNYDFVLLLIPLCYAIRNQYKSLRSKLYILAIIFTWYIEKVGKVMEAQNWVDLYVNFDVISFGLQVIFIYVAIFTDWYSAFKPRLGSLKTVTG